MAVNRCISFSTRLNDYTTHSGGTEVDGTTVLDILPLHFQSHILEGVQLQKAVDYVRTSTLTIRSVAQGVIGIAMVQATFVGIGFWAVDVPGAGLWTLFVLILSIAQMPPFLVILPVIGYVCSLDDMSTTTLVIFTAWSVFGGILDGILKPFVMGRGMDIPMMVILLGAIGGMILSGILGLFTGAIVLAIGYMLYKQWLVSDDVPVEEKQETA